MHVKSIAFAGQSLLKLTAVSTVFPSATIFSFFSNSNVNEQPEGEETFQGAHNRIVSMLQRNQSVCGLGKIEECDLYISIENGLTAVESAEDTYYDTPVIAFQRPGEAKPSCYRYTDAPMQVDSWVMEELRFYDFQKTVGDILYENGLVSDPKDPHKDRLGVRREDILIRAVTWAFNTYQNAFQ